jgi:hypothetical protein
MTKPSVVITSDIGHRGAAGSPRPELVEGRTSDDNRQVQLPRIGNREEI